MKWSYYKVTLINCSIIIFLTGRWVKIDSHQVPKDYFEHFLYKLKVKANSVRLIAHKSQPSYQSLSRKVSYKIFDQTKFFEVLDEGEVPFEEEVVYSGNSPMEEETMAAPLSAEEEIRRVKRSVHAPGVKRRRASSKTSLIIGYGEGRATRELEVIWWPDLYQFSEHGQMVVRFFLEKCEF